MTGPGSPLDDRLPSAFLVEASVAARALVQQHLEASSLVRIVGAAATLGAAAGSIAIHEPDVVIVDDLADLQAGFPQPPGQRFVLHATTVPAASLEELGRVGVHEVVFKEVGMLDDLVAAVRRAANREVKP